jgi:ankyrin
MVAASHLGIFLFKLFSPAELSQLEDLNTNRITRILTTDFPQYFAIVSRIRQEVHAIGPEGELFA